VKQGTGTWTFDKNLSVTGCNECPCGILGARRSTDQSAVNVSTVATLQLGAGSTAGNLIGNAVVDNGSVVFNRSDSLTFNANISGSGASVRMATGTTILGGGKYL